MGTKRSQKIRAEEFYTPKEDYCLLRRYEAVETHSVYDLSSVWIFLSWNNISLMLSGADFRELSASFTIVSNRRTFLYLSAFLPKVKN